jgi:hypothetical protein
MRRPERSRGTVDAPGEAALRGLVEDARGDALRAGCALADRAAAPVIVSESRYVHRQVSIDLDRHRRIP